MKRFSYRFLALVLTFASQAAFAADSCKQVFEGSEIRFSSQLVSWRGLQFRVTQNITRARRLVQSNVIAPEIPSAKKLIVGFDKFALGGLFVLPYIIPILTFVLLLVYGMKKSV